MPTKLQLKFDANQEHQVAAVESIAALFQGFARQDAAFQLGDEIVANLLPYEDLTELWLLDNLQSVQQQNGLTTQFLLDWESGMGLAGIADENHRFPHFTVEMETGTGKTYVYLRAIHGLRCASHSRWANFDFLRAGAIVPPIEPLRPKPRNHPLHRRA